MNSSFELPIDTDIFRRMIMMMNKDKETVQVQHMTEMITKEEMLLFLYKNKYKYFFIKFLEAILYTITRLSLLPLLLPITNSLNVVSIPFVIIFLIQSLKVKRTFLDDVKQKNGLVLTLLII